MSQLQLGVYDMLKGIFQEQGAKNLITYIEERVKEDVQHTTKELATKNELFATKEELLREMVVIKADLTKQIYIVGLIQFLAIVGSVIGIMTFMLHK